MSIENIKQQIKKFISTETPEVMAIKGEWGAGKTFSWNKFLQEGKEDNLVSLKRYSYVSLFGINSLDSLKYAIFENVINKDLIGTEANLHTFNKNFSSLIETKSRKLPNMLKGSKKLTPIIESLSFFSLNKTLICIDDLERAGSGLEIKDILGLVSLLKEQKKCKVVILFNDNKNGLDSYREYREKVIDIELKFSPTF